jgi:hypothetical protein
MTNTEIPLPAGAISCEPWQVDGDDITRSFGGTTRGDRLHIEIIGAQDYSGAIRRASAFVETPRFGLELDAAALRGLAADALAAADELDQLCAPVVLSRS